MTEEDSGPEASSAWCTSSSVGNTEFLFTWQISDYQRKKESVKRDDSIQSSTFTVQVRLLSLILVFAPFNRITTLLHFSPTGRSHGGI